MAERGAPLGNQNAAKGKRFQKAVERVLARKYGDVDTGYEAIAKIYIEIAESKDTQILRDIADRSDGKPAQAITGPDGGALLFQEIQRKIVKS
jgi:hypothetical protein